MELDELNIQILKHLAHGAKTQGALIDMSGETRYKMYDRMKLLHAAGYVKKAHESTALYQLADDLPANTPDEVIAARIHTFANTFGLGSERRAELFELLGHGDLADEVTDGGSSYTVAVQLEETD